MGPTVVGVLVNDELKIRVGLWKHLRGFVYRVATGRSWSRCDACETAIPGRKILTNHRWNVEIADLLQQKQHTAKDPGEEQTSGKNRENTQVSM